MDAIGNFKLIEKLGGHSVMKVMSEMFVIFTTQTSVLKLNANIYTV